MRWCAWCLSWREIWQTPCSGMVVHYLILSRLDTLRLKRDRLDGPLMTRMMFWLCKGRKFREIITDQDIWVTIEGEIINTQFPPRALWDVMRQEGLLGYLRPFDAFLASLGVIFYVRINSSPITCDCFAFSCTLFAERWPSCRRLRYSLEVPPVWSTSVLSGAFHHLLIVRLWSPSIFSPAVVCVFFGAASLVVWVDTLSLGWGLSACCPSVLNPWLRKGNVVYSHIQFDFLWGLSPGSG